MSSFRFTAYLALKSSILCSLVRFFCCFFSIYISSIHTGGLPPVFKQKMPFRKTVFALKRYMVFVLWLNEVISMINCRVILKLKCKDDGKPINSFIIHNKNYDKYGIFIESWMCDSWLMRKTCAIIGINHSMLKNININRAMELSKQFMNILQKMNETIVVALLNNAWYCAAEVNHFECFSK